MNMFKSIFSSGSSSSPPPPPPPPAPAPPTEDQAAKRLQAQQEAGRIRKGQGYAATILTSGQGDTSQATTYKKTLLGA